MRYDFGDQFQVRYQHSNGEFFDTWVSGDEAIQRLSSEETEEQLKSLRRLDLAALRKALDKLPGRSREQAWRSLSDRVGDSVEDMIGGNIIGDGLADAVRGNNSDTSPKDLEMQRWLAILEDEVFRTKVLELAWIQLDGSFPDDESSESLVGWV
jgi:hypothetical protein